MARLRTDHATLVDLDTTTPPGPWRARLERTLGSAPAGGRVVFNVVSQDYLDATGSGSASRGPGAGPAAGADELAGFASDAGLAIAALVPYGALLGHPTGGESLLAPLDLTYRWRRSVSWLARDDDLLRLVRFLEEHLVSKLPAAFAPYLMVALDRPGTGSDDSLGRRRAASPPATALADRVLGLGLDPAVIGRELDPLLVGLKPRLLLFSLLDHLSSRWPEVDGAAWLTPVRAEQYDRWRRANRTNQDVTRLARQWSDGVPERVLHGADATLAVDYRLIRLVMEDYLHLFDEAAP